MTSKTKIVNVLQETADFTQAVYTQPITDKDIMAQFAAHVEEFTEMLDQMAGGNIDTHAAIGLANAVCKELKDHLKTPYAQVQVKDEEKFLDSLADQITTATVLGTMRGADVVGALAEVNRSQYSKLVDGVMQRTESGKWKKGPNFVNPDLKPFLPKPIVASAKGKKKAT